MQTKYIFHSKRTRKEPQCCSFQLSQEHFASSVISAMRPNYKQSHQATLRAPKAVWGKSVHSLEDATQYILILLYKGQASPQAPVSGSTRKEQNRNDILRQRYAEGEPVADLAKALGISEQRIYQILKGKRN